jgi:copper chaperone NosL
MKFTFWRQALAVAVLAGCGQAASLYAVDPAADTACSLDGMVLRDFPGAKAQIRYADGKTEYFCDVVELLRMLLAPEQARGNSAQYVQDMGKADWNHPQGHWIAAKEALYVVGSRAVGSMGPTVVPFAQMSDAHAFVAREGGKVVRFADITLALLDTRAHGH